MDARKNESDPEMDVPMCSVCIANYNGMEVIDDCLRSVLEQQGNLSMEILVHDDASSDGSVDYIRRQYPQATLIVSDNNVGFCMANNRMAAAARGKYILLLNNDAALYPDAVQTLFTEANRLGQPAILGLPQYESASGKLLDVGSLLDPFLNPIPNLDPRRRGVGMVIGASLWIPRALWNELGGFPTWFESIGEDLYLCCRARLLGHPVLALNTSGYNHRVGHSFGGGKLRENRLTTSFKRRALSERNKTYVMVLSYPALSLAIIFPLHITILLFEGAVLALIKRDIRIWSQIYLPCFRALWQNRRSLRSLRHEIQAQRRCRTSDFFSVFHWVPHKVCMLWKHGLPAIR